MLSRMAPSSPLAMRTLHLLKTPDILCANDKRLSVSYCLSNGWEKASLVWRDQSDKSYRGMLGLFYGTDRRLCSVGFGTAMFRSRMRGTWVPRPRRQS